MAPLSQDLIFLWIFAYILDVEYPIVAYYPISLNYTTCRSQFIFLFMLEIIFKNHTYVTVCFGIPRTSSWLYCTKALVTKSCRTWQPSPTSLGIHGLRSRRPQRRIECSKRRCRLRDVKRVTASCRNDIMVSYKSSRPVGNATTFQLLIGYWLPTVPSAVIVQPCALPEPFRRFSLFPWIKAVF